MKKHCKKECSLFMAKTLSDKDKHGWGRNQDKATLPGPFGRPENHVWEGKLPGQKKVTKSAPILKETRYFKEITKFKTMVQGKYFQCCWESGEGWRENAGFVEECLQEK